MIAFFTYLAVSTAFVVAGVFVYLWATPYRELALIRDGNAAAAASLSGALTGLALPMASLVSHAVSIADLAMWAAVAVGVQLVWHGIAHLLLRDLRARVESNNVAAGVFLGFIAAAAGLLNAAALTY